MRMLLSRVLPASLLLLATWSPAIGTGTALAYAPPSIATASSKTDSQLQRPPTLGTATPINDASGVHLSVAVNAVEAPPAGVTGGPPGGGSWVAIDVSVTNTGALPFELSAGDFQLMSPSTVLFRPDGASDLPVQQLPDTVLAAGQTVNGSVIFDIPSGSELQLVTFQASGMSQWVVTLLSPSI